MAFGHLFSAFDVLRVWPNFNTCKTQLVKQEISFWPQDSNTVWVTWWLPQSTNQLQCICNELILSL